MDAFSNSVGAGAVGKWDWCGWILDTFGDRWVSSRKVGVALEHTAVEGVCATLEAGVAGRPGAFRRPTAARHGESIAVGERFGGATTLAKGNGADRPAVKVTWPFPTPLRGAVAVAPRLW